MKSLKIILVLFFALFLCTSCVANDGNETNTDTKHAQSSETASNTDTESDTDMANDGKTASDTDNSDNKDTNTEISEQTRRIRTHAREWVAYWIGQVQSTTDAYLR